MSHHEERPEKTWVSSFFFIFGSFREIYTRYYERHKADVSFSFLFGSFEGVIFQGGLLRMSVPWSFEYVDTSYELEPENPTEEAFDVNHFITVLEVISC